MQANLEQAKRKAKIIFIRPWEVVRVRVQKDVADVARAKWYAVTKHVRTPACIYKENTHFDIDKIFLLRTRPVSYMFIEIC